MAHRALELTLCVVAFGVFVLNILVNSYIGAGGERFGLNFSSIGDVSRQYRTDITPAGWAFSIWGLIYLWQILLQIYLGLTILFRDTSSPTFRFLDVAFPYLSLFYILYIINYLVTIGWVFVWCLGYVVYAAPLLALTSSSLWYALRIVVTGSATCRLQSSLGEQKALAILFVHNGIGLYATWTAIATMINIVVTLVYHSGLEMDRACVIALSILSVLVLVWFALDIGLLKKKTRYLLTPYCVLSFALSSSIVKNWDDGSTPAIFSLVLLAVGSLMLLLKAVMIGISGFPCVVKGKTQKGYEKQMLVN